MHRLSFLLLAVFLAGCAGAQYRLPVVNERDTAAVEAQLRNYSYVSKFKRTDAVNKHVVGQVAARLAAGAGPLCVEARYVSCHFKVLYVKSDDVNAYAMGQGEVHISRGLLEYLESEEEVAAVVAHEMAHHIANHVQEQQQNAGMGAMAVGALAALVLGRGEASQQAIRDAMQVGAEVGQISYSKEQEREADLMAAYLLARAGYNLQRAGRVWQVLALLTQGGGAGSLLSTHPSGPDRIVAWQAAINEVQASQTGLPQPR